MVPQKGIEKEMRKDPETAGKHRVSYKRRKEFVKKHGLNFDEDETMETGEEEKQGYEIEGERAPYEESSHGIRRTATSDIFQYFVEFVWTSKT